MARSPSGPLEVQTLVDRLTRDKPELIVILSNESTVPSIATDGKSPLARPNALRARFGHRAAPVAILALIGRTGCPICAGRARAPN